MFKWLRNWLKKIDLKHELEKEMKYLFMLCVWGELLGDYDQRLIELKELYITKGLSRQEVEKIYKNFSPTLEIG